MCIVLNAAIITTTDLRPRRTLTTYVPFPFNGLIAARFQVLSPPFSL